MNLRNATRGFTMIELMVVIAIIAILSAVAIQSFVGRTDKAMLTKVKHDITTIESALDLYREDNHVYPSTDQGLQALVTQPSGEPEASNWNAEGYLKKLPKDPWGEPYYYLSPGEHGTVDIYSLGHDKRPGGEGLDAEIGNWNLDSIK